MLIARGHLYQSGDVTAGPQLDLQIRNLHTQKTDGPILDSQAIRFGGPRRVREFNCQIDRGFLPGGERPEQLGHVQDTQATNLDMVTEPLGRMPLENAWWGFPQEDDVIGDETVPTVEQRQSRFAFPNATFAGEQNTQTRHPQKYSMDGRLRSKSLFKPGMDRSDRRRRPAFR